MDVCPKCHNRLIYGMNCCTGQRILNEPPTPGLADLFTFTSCTVCGPQDGSHDPWKHGLMLRLQELEKEVADLKSKVK